MSAKVISKATYLEIAKALIIGAHASINWANSRLKAADGGDFVISVDGSSLKVDKKTVSHLNRAFPSYVSYIFRQLADSIKRQSGIRGYKEINPQWAPVIRSLVASVPGLSASTVAALTSQHISGTLLTKLIWAYYYTNPQVQYVRPEGMPGAEKKAGPGAFFVPVPGNPFSAIGMTPNTVVDGNQVFASYSVNQFIGKVGVSLKDTKESAMLSNTLSRLGKTKEMFDAEQTRAVEELDQLISSVTARKASAKAKIRSPMPGTTHAKPATADSESRRLAREARNRQARADLTGTA